MSIARRLFLQHLASTVAIHNTTSRYGSYWLYRRETTIAWGVTERVVKYTKPKPRVPSVFAFRRHRLLKWMVSQTTTTDVPARNPRKCCVPFPTRSNGNRLWLRNAFLFRLARSIAAEPPVSNKRRPRDLPVINGEVVAVERFQGEGPVTSAHAASF